MALYENLPVYKLAYNILLEVYRMNINLSREYRYTLGENLKNQITELLITLYKANANEKTKESELRTAREHLVVVKLCMRLLHDLNQISVKRLAAFTVKTETLSKQLAAWHKSTQKIANLNPESVRV